MLDLGQLRNYANPYEADLNLLFNGANYRFYGTAPTLIENFVI